MATKLVLYVNYDGETFTIDWERPKYQAGIIAAADVANDVMGRQELAEYNICAALRLELEQVLRMKMRMFAGRKAIDVDAKGPDSGSRNETGTTGQVGEDRSPVAPQHGQQDGDQAAGHPNGGQGVGVAQDAPEPTGTLPTGGPDGQVRGG